MLHMQSGIKKPAVKVNLTMPKKRISDLESVLSTLPYYYKKYAKLNSPFLAS